MVVQVKSLESELRKSQRLLEDLREKTKHEEVLLYQPVLIVTGVCSCSCYYLICLFFE